MSRAFALVYGRVCVAAAATLLSASAATAQACIGYPQGTTGAAVAGFSFPEGATGYSLTGLVGSQRGFAFLQASFGIVAPDVEALESTKVASASFAFEVPPLAPEVSFCPVGGFSFSWVEDTNVWSVPFGVAVGGTIPLGRGGEAGLTPFAIPQFIYVREQLEGFDAESDVFVGVTAGATVNVGPFLVRGSMAKIFEQNLDAVFSVGVGAAWR